MHDHTGARIEEARPGDPVEVLGFDGVCEAGERVEAVENDRRARQLAAGARAPAEDRAAGAPPGAPASPSTRSSRRRSEGEIKELNIVLKADVSGSLEALQDEIAKLPQEEVAVNVDPRRRRAGSTSPT